MYVIIYVKDKKNVNFRAHKKKKSPFLWEVGVWRSTSELRFLASDSEERSNMARVPEVDFSVAVFSRSLDEE